MPRMKVQIGYLNIGAFVAMAVLLMTSVSLLFGFSRFLRRTTTYVTYFKEVDRGLQRDSAVYYKGISVGKVSSIRLCRPATNQYIEVCMRIDASADFEVNDNTYIQLETPLIAGPASLTIFDYVDEGIPSSEWLDFEPQLPAIRSVSSPIQKLRYKLESLLGKLVDFDITAIQTNLLNVMDAVENRLADKRLDETVDALHDIAQRAAVLVSNVDPEVVAETLTSLQGASSNLLALSATVERALNSNYLARLSHNSEAAISQMPSLLSDVHRTANEIREVSASIKKLSDRMHNNPSDVVFSDPVPKSETIGDAQ